MHFFLGAFGDISYSLVGDQSKHFNIDAESGVITVQNSSYLDRERQKEISFAVMASDKAPVTTRRSTVVPVRTYFVYYNISSIDGIFIW